MSDDNDDMYSLFVRESQIDKEIFDEGYNAVRDIWSGDTYTYEVMSRKVTKNSNGVTKVDNKY